MNNVIGAFFALNKNSTKQYAFSNFSQNTYYGLGDTQIAAEMQRFGQSFSADNSNQPPETQDKPTRKVFKLRPVKFIVSHKKAETPLNQPTQKVVEEPKKELTLAEQVAKINSIQDNEQKVKEWAKLTAFGNYTIIDKQKCLATVYSQDGKELTSFEVGLGSEIGDDYNDGYGKLGKAKCTTPAGEYTTNTNTGDEAEYGAFSLSLGYDTKKGENMDSVVSLHETPISLKGERDSKFYNGKIEDNRMSHGCINFLGKDFKKLTTDYIPRASRVYVLPEETDNSLMLTTNDKGILELTQTKYKKASD